MGFGCGGFGIHYGNLEDFIGEEVGLLGLRRCYTSEFDFIDGFRLRELDWTKLDVGD